MVTALRPLEQEVVVEHQEIPGFMMAMTMPFTVRETNELTGLIPGEEIAFKLIVTDNDAWIEDIKKTGTAKNILPKNAGIRIARDVDPLEIGDALPEYHFVNEQGQSISLSQFRGNALVLSFLFTRCPLPQFCPLTAKKLAETQDQLSELPGGPTNWHILALSIDPEFDTPERLRQFGETYGYDPERWSLLTGDLIDITALAEQFGLLFWTEDGTINHNLRTVVVGADGTIRTNIIGNEWRVNDLVQQVREAAAGGKAKE
jgi:protein SCO1/2